MKELTVSELKDNMFHAIGKEWMLVTAGTPEKFNTMTASWGGRALYVRVHRSRRNPDSFFPGRSTQGHSQDMRFPVGPEHRQGSGYRTETAGYTGWKHRLRTGTSDPGMQKAVCRHD